MQKKPFALLSVYEKKGIVEFARELITLGFHIISSGGTAKALMAEGVLVTDVAEISNLEAVLGHRVVTLVPQVHGGLLAADHQLEELEKLGWPRIDLVCVDLYPLKDEVRNPAATRESVIEKTDIGGPTMLRSGAKGRRIVVCDPADRPRVIAWLKEGKPDADTFVNTLVVKAEHMISDYCLESARYHSNGGVDGVSGTRTATCKYGENAWQTPAMLFSTETDDPLALDRFQVIAGTPPSYNNYCDIDKLLQTMTHAAQMPMFNHDIRIAVGVKHGNACGAAFGEDVVEVLRRVVAGDPRAIFGGLIMTNFAIKTDLAEVLAVAHMPTGKRRLLDAIIAPSFIDGTIDVLKRKGDKCRFIANKALGLIGPGSLDTQSRFRYVRGGFLKQPNYTFVPDMSNFNILKTHTRREMAFAWAIGSTSNSNTITLVKDQMLIGNGVGQQDRVSCCELAIKRARDAGHDPKGAVAYSDSFFPFTDGPETLIKAGISTIFATSGSVNDEKVRKVCEDADVALYLLPDAEARGFYGH